MAIKTHKSKREKILGMSSAWVLLLTDDKTILLLQVLPGRTTFEHIATMAEKYFWVLNGDYCEKALSAKNKTNKLPTFTCYTTKEYQELSRIMQRGLPEGDEYARALQAWQNVGNYYCCGYTTRIEARKVKNLGILEGGDLPQLIEWDEMRNGKLMRRSLQYESPSLGVRLLRGVS